MLQRAELQCPGHFSRLLMDKYWLLLRSRLSFPLLDKLFYHYSNPATCVPLYDPMFPLFPPSLPAPGPPYYHSGCWLVQAGDLHVFPPVRQSPHCRPVPVQTTVTDVGDPVFLYKCILTVTL